MPPGLVHSRNSAKFAEHATYNILPRVWGRRWRDCNWEEVLGGVTHGEECGSAVRWPDGNGFSATDYCVMLGKSLWLSGPHSPYL